MITVHAPDGVDEARQRVSDALLAAGVARQHLATCLAAISMLEKAAARAERNRMAQANLTRDGAGLGLG